MQKRLVIAFAGFLVGGMLALEHLHGRETETAQPCCHRRVNVVRRFAYPTVPPLPVVVNYEEAATTTCPGMICPVYSCANQGEYWVTYAVQCDDGLSVRLDTQGFYSPNGKRCNTVGCPDCIQVRVDEKGKGKGADTRRNPHTQGNVKKGLQKGPKAPKLNPIPAAQKKSATLLSGPVIAELVTKPNAGATEKGTATVALYLILIDPSKEMPPLDFPKTIIGTGVEVATADEVQLKIGYDQILKTDDHVCTVGLGDVVYQIVLDKGTTLLPKK